MAYLSQAQPPRKCGHQGRPKASAALLLVVAATFLACSEPISFVQGRLTGRLSSAQQAGRYSTRVATRGSVVVVHAGEDSSKRILRVSRRTNVGKLAGAITQRLDSEGKVEATAISPESVNQLLIAMTWATRYLGENKGDGTAVAASVKRETTQTDNGRNAVVLHFSMKEVESPSTSGPAKNVRKGEQWDDRAAELTKTLGKDDHATLSGKGADATYSAVRVIEIAGTNMAAESTDGDYLALIPSLVDDGKSRPHLELHCEKRAGFVSA